MTDKEIIEFINNLPDDFSFSEGDITYLSNFRGCEPPVPPSVISKMREAITGIFSFFFEEDPFGDNRNVNVLAVGYGADKILKDNMVNTTSFQSEYYCTVVARALNQKKFIDGTYKVRFRDLADYFTNYKGNNLKYNLVVITPDITHYHEIDSDYHFKNMNSFTYYTLRGFYFVRPGGVLFSVIPTKYEQSIRDGMQYLDNAKLGIKQVNDDYSIITIEHNNN